jgi:hypothetical protein
MCVMRPLKPAAATKRIGANYVLSSEFPKNFCEQPQINLTTAA